MDLLDKNRPLIHTGKFWKKSQRRDSNGIGGSKLFVLLLDKYRGGVTP